MEPKPQRKAKFFRKSGTTGEGKRASGLFLRPWIWPEPGMRRSPKKKVEKTFEMA